jgi:G3E family GTPase
MKTPTTLITGSLGSGKTTLLRRILQQPERRVAVLMNEFGEIAIDSRVIEGEHVQIVELQGGCVCCSLTGEFEAAINEIIEKAQPELIVVETTGVAEADALVFEVEESLPQVRLDGVVCLVDAYATVRFPHLGRVTRTQLEAADIILLNKMDLVDARQAEAVREQIRRVNQRAVIFETVRCDLDSKLLFGLDVERRVTPAEHHHDVEFESFIFAAEEPLDRQPFESVIAELPASVYRAKGFVCFSDGSYLFNYVVGRWDVEEFAAEKTRLVFIGQDLAKDQPAIFNQLQRCAARALTDG